MEQLVEELLRNLVVYRKTPYGIIRIEDYGEIEQWNSLSNKEEVKKIFKCK